MCSRTVVSNVSGDGSLFQRICQECEVTRDSSPVVSPKEIYLELLHSLEKAHGRLSVAIATESKATTLERLRYYRETESRMQRCLRELRLYKRSDLQGNPGWVVALNALKDIPAAPEDFAARHRQTLHLCECLREALNSLEQLQAKNAKSD